MTSEKIKLAKAVINSDIQQFQATMKDMIDQRIVEKFVNGAMMYLNVVVLSV